MKSDLVYFTSYTIIQLKESWSTTMQCVRLFTFLLRCGRSRGSIISGLENGSHCIVVDQDSLRAHLHNFQVLLQYQGGINSLQLCGHGINVNLHNFQVLIPTTLNRQSL
jgi:hypothetical protein